MRNNRKYFKLLLIINCYFFYIFNKIDFLV